MSRSESALFACLTDKTSNKTLLLLTWHLLFCSLLPSFFSFYLVNREQVKSQKFQTFFCIFRFKSYKIRVQYYQGFVVWLFHSNWCLYIGKIKSWAFGEEITGFSILSLVTDITTSSYLFQALLHLCSASERNTYFYNKVWGVFIARLLVKTTLTFLAFFSSFPFLSFSWNCWKKMRY